MSIYEDLRDVVNEAAQELGQDRSEFKSANIRDWIIAKHPTDWPRFEPSFQVNFSYATTSDSKCRVERVPGKFFYRLVTDEIQIKEDEKSATDIMPSDPQSDSTQSTFGKMQREVKLYSVLRDWLESKGYQAQITSSSKSGGTWGNPDVTGLRLDELPTGPMGFESATIEAKLSLDSWRYWIFESVAHKRFAHRAWFAFAVGTDSPSLSQIKDAEVLAEYAEKYRIGILVAFISPDHYTQLTTGDATCLDLGPDDVRIEVLWPAIYENVHVPALSEFMVNVLDIKNHNDFGQFGR